MVQAVQSVGSVANAVDGARATDIIGKAGVRASLRTLLTAGRKLDVQDPAVARQTAEQLGSELFFKPLLAEMRKFPLGRQLSDERSEAVFGEQLDQRLADSVAAATPGLTNVLLRHFGAPQPTAASATTPAAAVASSAEGSVS